MSKKINPIENIFSLYELTAFYNSNKRLFNRPNTAELREYFRKSSLEIKSVLAWDLDKIDIISQEKEWVEVIERFSNIFKKSLGVAYAFSSRMRYSTVRSYRLYRDISDCFMTLFNLLEKTK